jgi:hypothetical protein
VKPNFNKGDWVAQHEGDRPHFGQARELFRDGDDWLVNIDMWTADGDNPHRLSPDMGGPTTFEPACPAARYRKIERPVLPLDERKRTLYGGYAHLLKFVL